MITNRAWNSTACKALLLAGTSLCAIPSYAVAQQSEISEIIVTARRVNERLQDIPMNATAITGETLEKMNVNRFEEIAKLTPGLSLDFGVGGNTGSNSQVTLRGVTWKSSAGAVTIPVYLNEVSLNPNWALQSVFDIGQIEVLRGPQGTTRGESSISGAITLTTRRPDLDVISGYVSGLAATRDHYNVQAAIGVPVIKDKLAIRLAGTMERNRSNDIESVVAGAVEPRDINYQFRGTMRFEPAEAFDVSFMYQRQNMKSRYYQSVMGAGSPGRTVAGTPPRILPPNFNGPALTVDDRKAVSDTPTHLTQWANIYNVQANWRFMEHTLSYVGGFNYVYNNYTQSGDAGNLLVGFDNNNRLFTEIPQISHEIRIANDPGSRIDYVIGGYFTDTDSLTLYDTQGAFNTGAFGGVGVTPNPFYPPTVGGATNYYNLATNLNIRLQNHEKSVFGNAVIHILDGLDLSGGVRYKHIDRPGLTILSVGPFVQLVPCAVPGTTPSAFYAGSCDLNLATFNPPQRTPYAFNPVFNPVIYNVNLSYKFTPDVMVYATHGTGFKMGLSNIINVASTRILFSDPEKAKSYEVGVKSAWLGGRLVANADVFQIDYKGNILSFPNIPYRNSTNPTAPAFSSSTYMQNANSRVRGIEAELNARLTENFSLGSVFSYVDVKSTGGDVPCIDPTRPITATNEMNFCPLAKGLDVSQSPSFQITLAPEFSYPFGGAFEFYARSQIKFNGRNRNYGYPAAAHSYTMVDASLGVNNSDQGWDVGVFVKNLLDKNTVLQTGIDPGTSGTIGTLFGPSGYTTQTMVRPREFGVTARYSF